MAHHKLATVAGRSFLTATAAALIVGPLAAAGAAQTVEGVTDTLKLTCEEAFETEDTKLIEQFCTEAELAELPTSPLEKSVDEVTSTVDKTVGETTAGAPSPEAPGEEEPAPSGPVDPEVVPGDDDGGQAAPKPGTKTDVGSTGGNFSGVDEGSGIQKGSKRPGTTTSTPVESAGYGFNMDGPFRPGMRSNSSLTLQPFAAPLVSVPPIYELPQIAQQLFSGDSGAEAPVAATAASPYSATGYSATSADPTGWLAATATGLIMLVGAGHAINGGRTPKQHRA